MHARYLISSIRIYVNAAVFAEGQVDKSPCLLHGAESVPVVHHNMEGPLEFASIRARLALARCTGGADVAWLKLHVEYGVEALTQLVDDLMEFDGFSCPFKVKVQFHRTFVN